jgi:hypothetical protein
MKLEKWCHHLCALTKLPNVVAQLPSTVAQLPTTVTQLTIDVVKFAFCCSEIVYRCGLLPSNIPQVV